MFLVHLLIEALVEPPLGLRLRLWLSDPLLSAFNDLKAISYFCSESIYIL